MRVSIAFTTFFAALSVLALPVAKRDSEPSLSLRSDNVLSGEAIFYIRALTKAHIAAKAAKAVTHKAAGLATQKSKSKDQAKTDRKTRKGQEAVNKLTKANKAKAKPGYKSHHEKMIQKVDKNAKVKFSAGASRRLDGMDLHGKDRKAAKKFHKNIMKNEMKKNGAAKGNIVATAHTDGTVKGEKNHITAQFTDHKGQAVPSTWKDSKTGATKVGEKNQHHVYVDEKAKTPPAWTKAVDASNARKKDADAAKKADSDKAFADKGAAAKAAAQPTKDGITPDEKKAQRDAKKALKAAGKKAAPTL